MAIVFCEGDIFQASVDVIVNPVNCVGVMGAGLALEFKKRYPAMFEKYKEACNLKLLRPGMLQLHRASSPKVLNFPTKDCWRDPSELSYIESGLRKLTDNYQDLCIKSIAFPKIGCGYGKLKWKDVKEVLIKHLDHLEDLEVKVYV